MEAPDGGERLGVARPSGGARILHGAMRRLAQAFAVAAVPLLAVTAGAAPGAPANGASARAFAIRVVVPAGDGAGTTEVAAPPDAVQFAGGFVFPEDGSIVSTGPVTASVTASTREHAASASASSEVASISLFGGEVTVERVTGRSVASADAGEAAGSTAGSAVTGLVVGGTPVVAPAGQVPLGDWGYADVLVPGEAPTDDGHRGFVTALDIHVTADHGGLTAGSEILAGYADAAATAAPPPPPPPPAVAPRTLPPPATSGGPAPRSSADTATRARAKARKARSRPRIHPVPTIAPKLTKKGYVFPVYGPSSFVDTFGAGRADTGWHHGEDVFAALGAPVLAVADGTVFSVGWNNVGGNRVWLRDTKGNEFYYAHLSAFSPLAVDGAHVEAGDVLGFVGRSGDAERTPPHLHFEIHPVGLLALGYDGVINPYEYLLAWERLEDVRFVAGATWVPTLARIGNAPTPGAFLLSSTDISTAASLRARELARVLGQGPPREAT
jgi:murein DD-endopeptidase MepM/ murein hydrolase activator NlpD